MMPKMKKDIYNTFAHHLFAAFYLYFGVQKRLIFITMQYLDLNLFVSNGTVSTKIYDKQDDFDFDS